MDWKTVISGPRIEFRPDRQLEPSADYVLEAEGIAGLAGNAGRCGAFNSTTAGDSTPPREFPNVIRTTLQAGDPGPQDVFGIPVQCAIRAGGTNVSVTMSVPRFSIRREYWSPVSAPKSRATRSV